MTKRFPVLILAALLLLAAPALGGRVQLQYYRADPDGGESTDDLFFRRLRPYIAGTVTENWMGKIQVDFGKAGDDDEVAVKDAYLQYKKGNIHYRLKDWASADRINGASTAPAVICSNCHF